MQMQDSKCDLRIYTLTIFHGDRVFISVTHAEVFSSFWDAEESWPPADNVKGNRYHRNPVPKLSAITVNISSLSTSHMVLDTCFES